MKRRVTSSHRATKEKEPFTFRVIAGDLKGREISAPDLGVTRPPLTRIRKSIFDFLNPYLPDARYLDLFSGTGSYLFEAVSRHVTQAVGVEMEMALAESINRQANVFGVADRLLCRCGDVFELLPRLAEEASTPFDIVMIAPPQYGDFIPRTLATLAVANLTHRDSLVLTQHDSKEAESLDWSALTVSSRRHYGNTTFTIGSLNG